MTLDIPTLILIAFALGLFYLWYFYHRDRYHHEPLRWLFWVFLVGMSVTIPVAFIENQLGSLITEFQLSVITAPVIEELAKFSVVALTVYQEDVFDKPVDGIVSATAAALGFATIENMAYVLRLYESSFSLALQTGVIQAFLSVPAHALFSSVWGYALGRTKFSPGQFGPSLIVGGMMIAIILHGLSNFLLSSYIGLAIVILRVIPLSW